MAKQLVRLLPRLSAARRQAACAPYSLLRSFSTDNEPERGQEQTGSSGRAPDDSQSNEHPLLSRHRQQLLALKGSTKVQRQTLGADVPAWQAWIARTVGNWMERALAEVISSRVEKQFSLEDTLAGAEDAFFIVNKLLSEHDWEGLRAMVSPRLLRALQDTAAEYRGAGLVWRTELEGQPEARLHGLAFLSAEELARYNTPGDAPDAEAAERSSDAAAAAEACGEPAAAGEAGAADAAADGAGGSAGARLSWPAGAWMVLTVQLHGEQLTTITREQDGHLVAELRDLRPTRWRFATGPLPDSLPAGQLETQWQLLAI